MVEFCASQPKKFTEILPLLFLRRISKEVEVSAEEKREKPRVLMGYDGFPFWENVERKASYNATC